MRRLECWVVVLLVMGSWTLLPTPAAAADGGLRWSDQPTPASGAAEMACADVLFVGARGSLEDGPYGGMVRNWRDRLAERTATVPERGVGQVREVYVDYPAVGPDTMLQAGLNSLLFAPELPDVPYLASVETGVTAAEWVLADSLRRCPDERWVLVGYSQGAQVINEVLADGGAAYGDRLLAAALLGSPGHYEGQSVTEAGGDAPATASGLTAALHYIRGAAASGRSAGGDDHATAAGVQAVLEVGQGRADGQRMAQAAEANHLAIDTNLQERVFSLCNAGDIVCDAGPAIHQVVINGSDTEQLVAQSWDAHHAYQPAQTATVADRIVERIRAATPAAEVPRPTPQPPVLSVWMIAGGAVVFSLLVALGVALVQLARRRDS